MILSFQRKYTIHLPCPHGTGSIRRNSTGCGVPYWRTGLFLTYINNTKFFSNGSQATVTSCVLRISVRTWSVPAANEQIKSGDGCQGGELQAGADNCENKRKLGEVSDVMEEVSKSHKTIQSLQKTVSTLEKELAASRATQGLDHNGSPVLEKPVGEDFGTRQKAYIVIGINTAFSSRKRRDSIRETWMPKGKKLAQLEQEKGIVIRFVIGRSVMPGGILDHAIETEDAQHNDFLRLDHVEGYHELSAKTKIYFATAVSKWDADFYVKVDDDVHVNPGMLTTTLSRYQSKPRIYIGCMKSGPVLAKRDAKYYEPEHWKFGEQGNKYFRHASGGIYAISQDLARYVSVNSPILHKYANEDVSLGAWFIGLDVEHIDDRNMCCGTPPDCQWKAEAGNVCAATFDWHCSGICKSVDRIKDVHKSCGEGEDAVWNTFF